MVGRGLCVRGADVSPKHVIGGSLRLRLYSCERTLASEKILFHAARAIKMADGRQSRLPYYVFDGVLYDIHLLRMVM